MKENENWLRLIWSFEIKYQNPEIEISIQGMFKVSGSINPLQLTFVNRGEQRLVASFIFWILFFRFFVRKEEDGRILSNKLCSLVKDSNSIRSQGDQLVSILCLKTSEIVSVINVNFYVLMYYELKDQNGIIRSYEHS